jgi:hypothetical protein
MLKSKSVSKKFLALALAVVMAVSLFAVSAYAASPVGGTPAQEHYFWWFGDSVYTPGHYPEFQPTPMGDDAVDFYVYDSGQFGILFKVMTYEDIPGWFSNIEADGADWVYDDSTHIGALIFENAPTAPTMIQLYNVEITLSTGTHPTVIGLDNVWFEVDYGPDQP